MLCYLRRESCKKANWFNSGLRRILKDNWESYRNWCQKKTQEKQAYIYQNPIEKT